MMQPRLLDDGQVCVDMGPPTLAAAQVPTTLPVTRDSGAAVAAELQVTPAQRQGHPCRCRWRVARSSML